MEEKSLDQKLPVRKPDIDELIFKDVWSGPSDR